MRNSLGAGRFLNPVKILIPDLIVPGFFVSQGRCHERVFAHSIIKIVKLEVQTFLK